MALRHGVLPKTLHVDVPSPEVDWSAGAVELLRENRPWPSVAGRPRRAGVSSFGISGTNVHVILEEAPEEPARELPAQRPRLPVVPWVVSGRGEDGLRRQENRFREWLAASPATDPAEVGAALAARTQLSHRSVWLGGDDRVAAGAVREDGVRVGFLFSGQGAQRVGMGRGLYEAFPVFAEAFDEVCSGFDGVLRGSLRDVVFGEGGGEGVLRRTEWAQPALFAVEVALFRLLGSWGVSADFVLGHSVGELAGACVGGVFSVVEGCRLVGARGGLMQGLGGAGGAMVSVRGSLEEVAASLPVGGGVVVAAVNGPRSVVVSGEESGVAAVASVWEGRGRKVRRLRVSHAFHSPLMDGMLEDFRKVAEGVDFRPSRIPVVSDVTGELISDEDLCSADYWVRQVREPVRFYEGMRTLARERVGVCVEIGPGGGLAASGAECVADEAPEMVLVPAMRRDRDEVRTAVEAVA
ncbi:acyltransferase domain-containing protein, partial [Streptomyces sp. NPDC003032]